MEQLIQTVYTIGGAWAVLSLALAYAVVHLYRAREVDRDKYEREMREREVMLIRVLQKRRRGHTLPPPKEASPTSEEPERPSWFEVNLDEPKVKRQRRFQEIKSIVEQYLDEDD